MKRRQIFYRILAAALCLCMLIPLVGMASEPVGEEEQGHEFSEALPEAALDENGAGDETIAGEEAAADSENPDAESDASVDGEAAAGEESGSEDEAEELAIDDLNAETASVRLWSFSGADEARMREYDAQYRVLPSGAPATNNGNYASSTPDRAVDNDPSTHWETGNRPGTDPSYLEFTFPEPVNIGRIVYGTRKDSAAGKGFPYRFVIQASQTDAGEDFETVVKGGYGTKTSEYIEISFSERSFKRLRFVFTEPAEGWASCREMMFYKADLSDELVNGLFTDYCMLTLSESYNTEEQIEQLREQLRSNPKYELSWKALLDRAAQVARGELTFDPRYELSTAPGAENVIQRNGDIVSYARNTLRFNSFTTNRQASGVAAYAGDTVTIYVTGEPGDKLPKIRFSQAYGHWTSWLSGELQLSLGVNTFTVPNFKNGNYTTRYVPAAGPIYIVNPYGPGEQSENVRLYIEGGDAYPVFRLGDDENEYKAELTAYADRVRADADHVIDVTELVCDHAIMTVTATRADELYDTASPQANLQKWNTILQETLAFEGVKFDRDDPYFDWRNLHLNVNYRVNQVWDGGYMFAASEMIGLYAGADGENTLIYCLDSNGRSTIGWGLVHEMGHTTDLPDRTIGETTNNMPANFVNTYYNGQVRNDDYIAIAHSLASDRDWNNNGFNQNRYNYMIFFLLESYYQSYWGDTDNIYRYVDDRSSYAAMTKTERYVYFASLAAGVDLGYYFERWGFNMNANEARFDRNSASAAYKSAMEAARQAGTVKVNELPIWYLDSREYAYIRDNGLTGDKSGGVFYTEGGPRPEAPTVVKTSDGYSLALPVVDAAQHLGYEIWEGTGDGKQRIGYTTGNAFTDTYAYETGYSPVYSVVAYDRVLSHTAFSDEARTGEAEDVCEVNGTAYESLGAAIAAANAGDTIYLLKDITDSGVTVSKNVIITPKDHDVTIYRAGNAPVFRLSGSVNLKLVSAEGKAITLDGRNMAQSYPLIYMTDSATLDMTGGVVQNSVSSGYAAIAAVSWYSYARVSGVTFKNNSGVNGGAIYTHGLYPSVVNCAFTGNKATYGAAVYNCGGYMTLNNITASDNSATYGGVLYSDGSTEIRGGSFTNNRAVYGGAVSVSPSGYSDVRSVSVTNGAQFSGNTADYGSLIYLQNTGKATLTKAVVDTAGTEPYVLYMNSGRVILDGSQTDLSGAVYMHNGSLTMQKRMVEGTLTVTLGEYSAADPIVSTDFAVSEADMGHIVMADSGRYRLRKGEDGRNICLVMSNTVTLDPNGGTILKRNLTGYIHGETTLLPTASDIVKTGSTFVGWYENGDFNTNSVKSIKPEDRGDKAYTAQWSATSYWIRYVTNGGTFTGDPVAHYTYSEAGTVTLPTAGEITRDGREFLGWYWTAQLDDSAASPEAVTEFDRSLNKNLTFYAKWSCAQSEAVRENDTAPSCTEEGSYDMVVYCADKSCGKELSRTRYTVEALGHAWGAWTQTADGVRTRSCSVCGVEESENLIPEGHVPQAEFTVDVAPTCETDGSASRRCTDCGIVLETKVLPRTGHTESPAVREREIPATCTQDGSYEELVYCEICHAVLSQKSVEVLSTGHAFGNWKDLPSSDGEETGGRQRRCEVCGYCETEGLDETAHRWSEEYTVDQSATCTADGSRSIHCLDCSAVKASEIIAATGHSAGEAVHENERAATCETDGSYVQATYCAVCFTLLSRETVTVPATGHDWTGWVGVNTAGCTNAGVQTRSCRNCGLEEYNNLDPAGHSWESDYTVDTAATCTTEGFRSIHCSVCSAKKDIRAIPATGHTAGETVRENEQAPSCTAAGAYYAATYCESCGAAMDRWPMTEEPLGHDFDDWFESGPSSCGDEKAKTRVCKRCGFTETEGMEAAAHQWAESFTVDREASCQSEGSESIRCLVCGAVKESRTIPRTGHTTGQPVKENVLEPSCTAPGSYTESVYCESCGALIQRSAVTTERTGHVFGEWEETLSPKCENGASRRRECLTCGYTETDSLDPAGHRPEAGYTVKTVPTCTTDGSAVLQCAECGAALASKVLPKLGHTRTTEGEKEATCTEEGYSGDVFCSVCGVELETGRVLPVSGHIYEKGFCRSCGQEDPRYPLAVDAAPGSLSAYVETDDRPEESGKQPPKPDSQTESDPVNPLRSVVKSAARFILILALVTMAVKLLVFACVKFGKRSR